jgi:Tol biopolymer transport system component
MKTAAIIPAFLLFLLGLQTNVFSFEFNGKIVFESNRDGNAEVYVMNPDGTNPVRLTSNSAADFDASFSPDGQKIAFVSSRDGSFQIYVMNIDGSGQTRIGSDSSNDIDPAWSPDGTRFAFASDRNGGRYQIYVMNIDGTNPVRVTNDSQNDTSPSWSPDGTKLVFDDAGLSIYVMNPDGSNLIRISNSADSQPSWSPDGTKIVFVTQRSGTAQIYCLPIIRRSHLQIIVAATIGSLSAIVTDRNRLHLPTPHRETVRRAGKLPQAFVVRILLAFGSQINRCGN